MIAFYCFLCKMILIVSQAFGFLGGQEVKDAGVGNLGLQDRAYAQNVVKTHIHRV